MEDQTSFFFPSMQNGKRDIFILEMEGRKEEKERYWRWICIRAYSDNYDEINISEKMSIIPDKFGCSVYR